MTDVVETTTEETPVNTDETILSTTTEETTETKVEEGKVEESKVEEKTEDKTEGAPETYEDFSMPEGVEVNAPLMDGFQSWAKEHNLSQQAAQQLVDMQTAEMVRHAKDSNERWEALRSDWSEASKSDAEFGGVSFDESVGLAVRVLDTYGTPELREALDVTGTGNHPEIIRLLVRVGKDISEDKFVKAPGKDERPPLANRMFPNQN